VQLENVTLAGYLQRLKLILLTYEGMKPLTADVHAAIAKWVRAGGILVVVDADVDPFLGVREWWNSNGLHFRSPREHLFGALGLDPNSVQETTAVANGKVVYLHRSPAALAHDRTGASWLYDRVRIDATDFPWKESGALILKRGPYIVAAGLDETSAPQRELSGKFVDLFDPDLNAVDTVPVVPGSRHLLVDLQRFKGRVIAASGAVVDTTSDNRSWSGTIAGIADTQGIMLLRTPAKPRKATIDGMDIQIVRYEPQRRLAWLKFAMQAKPERIDLTF
jgi:hypothetical protein